MPRPIKNRRVRLEPGVNYFKPAGVPLRNLDQVVLTVEEFESLKLKDFEGLGEIEAAKKMEISQPTFNRLVNSARYKIAKALSNGFSIKIEGGNYRLK